MKNEQGEKYEEAIGNEITLLERKISKVCFPEECSKYIGSINVKNHSEYAYNYICFPNSFEWTPNSGLSIVTGINGIGKSKLLRFLYHKLEDDYKVENDLMRHNRKVNNIQSRDAPGVPESFESENVNVIYIPHNFMPKGVAGPTKDIGTVFIEDIDRDGSGLKYLLLNLLESKTKNALPAVTNFATWENYPGKDFLNSVVERILKDTPNYENLEKSEILNKAKIYAMAEPTRIYLVATDFTLSFFISSFEAYKNLKNNIYKHNYDYQTLLNFYLKKNNLEGSEVIAITDLEKIFQGDNVESYKRERLNELWGSENAPWDEVNEQLLRLCPSFKHQFIYSHDIYFAPKNKEVKDLSECYRFEQLSTGEQMILSVLSWQYCQSGYSFTNTDINRRNIFKSDIILLDEPDRHFDPKLSKIFYQVIREVLVKGLGIQVIMTTHRIDTIALSNEGEVFTISQNEYNNIEIIPSHKLLAMFRLTSNLREFTNHHHRVYTESRDDALFYEGVYKTLMQYSNNLRQIEEIAAWQEHGSRLDDLLSRRFQLSLMSVSDNGDGGGSCSKVIEYIAKDITAYRNLERGTTSNFYNKIELCAPYGIVDNDYNKNHDFSKIHNAEGKVKGPNNPLDNFNVERVVVLKRHSLENYFFDPFIFSYAMQESEIIKIIDKNIKSSNSETEKKIKQDIKRICDEIHEEIMSGTPNLEFLRFKIEEYFKYIIFDSYKKPQRESILKEIEKKIWSFIDVEGSDLAMQKALDLTNVIYNEVEQVFACSTNQYDIDNHFNNLVNEHQLNKKDKKAFYQLCDIVKPERLLQYKLIESVKADRDIYVDGYEDIGIMSIRSKEASFFKYPKLFLLIRGHDIGSGIFGEKTIKEIIRCYIEKIYQDGLEYIPLDLVETIFELNNNVRTHVREILKPGKQKLQWSEKLLFRKSATDFEVIEDISINSSETDDHSPVLTKRAREVQEGMYSSSGDSTLYPSNKVSKLKSTHLDQSIEIYQDLYNKLGMSAVDVSVDGNCFFHAVERQLELLNNGQTIMNYQQIREFAHSYISNHRDEFKDFMVDETIDQYLDRMSQDGQWADHNFIQALSRELQINIVIISNNHIDIPQVIGSKKFQHTIYLGHIVELHYVSLEKISNDETADKNFAALESKVQQELLSLSSTSNEQKDNSFSSYNNDPTVLNAEISYNNPILNHPILLKQIYKLTDINTVNLFIELATNKDISEQIIEAIEALGLEKVLEILFGTKIKSSDTDVTQMQEQTILIKTQEGDQLLETIAKIEAVIGKEALAELAGWHQYISKALSHNSLSKHATIIIQSISNLINNLEEYLDFSSVYESVDADDQVAIILAQLENIFDFVASGIAHIGLPRRYPDFDPDDYYDGGGSSGGNGDYDGNQVDSTGFSLLFTGQNTTYV